MPLFLPAAWSADGSGRPQQLSGPHGTVNLEARAERGGSSIQNRPGLMTMEPLH